MRFLILEDDPQRHVAFRRKFGADRVTIVETPAEAIAALSTERWDALFLDHDLGGRAYVPSGPGTGYEVACWLERNADRRPHQIILHSLNAGGRARMKAALPDAIEAPFAWMPGKVTYEVLEGQSS